MIELNVGTVSGFNQEQRFLIGHKLIKVIRSVELKNRLQTLERKRFLADGSWLD